MRRVIGTAGVATQECVDQRNDIWYIRADIQPYTNEEDEEQGVSYWEEEVSHEPTTADWIDFENAIAYLGEVSSDYTEALTILGLEL